uniref:Protein sleepless n=1 Tax=Megaselia scalaris TaxID=36166 RepID=T1GYF4_MEGSC
MEVKMSHKLLVIFVICGLSLEAMALTCFKCQSNYGGNCVDRKQGETVECSDENPALDTNAYLGDFFNINKNITGSRYACINVYANFTSGSNMSYSGCVFKNASLTCDNLFNNPKQNTAILTTPNKNNPSNPTNNFACKICDSNKCNTSGANLMIANLSVFLLAFFLKSTL